MLEKGFLNFLFSGSFWKWWAIITGFVSILGYFSIPNSIYSNKAYFTILIFLVLTVIFLWVSTAYKGYSIQNNLVSHPKVVTFQSSEVYGGELVFIIESTVNIEHGTIAALQRFHKGVEVTFALIEFKKVNSEGKFQAHTIWIAPGHLRDIKSLEVSVSDITVDLSVQFDTLISARDEIIGRLTK